jgi:hypothetical protein
VLTPTAETTLPFTGMNQMPFGVTAGLSMLLGMALLAGGIVQRRKQQLALARTSTHVPARERK